MAIKFSFEDKLNPRGYGERHVLGVDESVEKAPRHGATVRHRDASPAAFEEAKARIVAGFGQWTGPAGDGKNLGGTLPGAVPEADEESFAAVVAAPIPALEDLAAPVPVAEEGVVRRAGRGR